MKFSNFLSKLGHFLAMSFFFIIYALLIPAIIVFLIVIAMNTDIYIAGAILIPVLLGGYAIPLNWFLGHVCGATFKNTGYIHEGRSMIDIVRDAPYYKRAIYVNFVIMGLFVLSIFYFVFVMTESFGWGMAGFVMSIIGAILYFIFAMSAIEKSGIKNKNKNEKIKSKEEFAEEFKNKEPIKKQQPKTKFNFDKYPEMLPIYNNYKHIKYSAVRLKYETTNQELYKEQCVKRDELFEILSEKVYETFNDKKPDLINKKTNGKIKWDELFDKPYEKLTHKQKDTMVRLLDASPYMFANKSFYNK